MAPVHVAKPGRFSNIRIQGTCNDVSFARDPTGGANALVLIDDEMDSVVWRDANQLHCFVVLIEVGDGGVLA
jgi:hypothetical protein